jgi:hypothetical protein
LALSEGANTLRDLSRYPSENGLKLVTASYFTEAGFKQKAKMSEAFISVHTTADCGALFSYFTSAGEANYETQPLKSVGAHGFDKEPVILLIPLPFG